MASTGSARTGGGGAPGFDALSPNGQGRAQRRPVWLLGAPPPSGCACVGVVAGWHARRSARASCSDSPRLVERSAPARSGFRGAPRNRSSAGVPLRIAKGSQTGGRLSLGYFSLARQRKVPRPPGRHPGSCAQPGHAVATAQPGFDKLSPNGLGGCTPCFDKLSPNGWGSRPGFDRLSPNGWRDSAQASTSSA